MCKNRYEVRAEREKELPVCSLSVELNDVEMDPAGSVAVVGSTSPVKSVKSVGIVESMESVSPVKSMESVSPVESMKSVSSVEGMGSVSPVKSVESVSPVESMKSVSSVKGMESVSPVGSVVPVCSTSESVRVYNDRKGEMKMYMLEVSKLFVSAVWDGDDVVQLQDQNNSNVVVDMEGELHVRDLLLNDVKSVRGIRMQSERAHVIEVECGLSHRREVYVSEDKQSKVFADQSVLCSNVCFESGKVYLSAEKTFTRVQLSENARAGVFVGSGGWVLSSERNPNDRASLLVCRAMEPVVLVSVASEALERNLVAGRAKLNNPLPRISSSAHVYSFSIGSNINNYKNVLLNSNDLSSRLPLLSASLLSPLPLPTPPSPLLSHPASLSLPPPLSSSALSPLLSSPALIPPYPFTLDPRVSVPSSSLPLLSSKVSSVGTMYPNVEAAWAAFKTAGNKKVILNRTSGVEASRDMKRDDEPVNINEKMIAELLRAERDDVDEGLKRAPFKLGIINKMKRKKAFAAEKMVCGRCTKHGHESNFCPLQANWKENNSCGEVERGEIDRDQYQTFMNVLKKQDESKTKQSDLEGMKLSEVSIRQEQKRVESEGAKLNEKNPWKECKERRNQLRANLGMWKALGVDANTLSWIANGVPIKLESKPKRYYFPSAKRTDVEQKFVEDEVQMHLLDGSFEEVEEERVLVGNPLTIARNGSGKLRMCIDSRYVNSKMAAPDFRMETLQRVAELIEEGDIMFTTDLKKAYYAVQLDEEARGLFAFNANNEEKKPRWIAPRVVVFGEAQAPWAFSKIVRKSVIKWARKFGIRVVNYIDDFIWLCKPHQKEWMREVIKWILSVSGWETNEKCDWEGKTRVSFLGIEVDSKKMEFVVGKEKSMKIKAQVKQAVLSGKIMNGDLQSLIGRIIATKIAMEPASVFTRYLQKEVLQEEEEGALIVLGKEAMSELKFWEEKWDECNGRPVVNALGGVVVCGKEIHMNTDAGAIGFGAHLKDGTETEALFTEKEMALSSTARELLGVEKSFAALRDKLRGNTVCLKMDSYAAVRNLIKGGGPSSDCCEVVQRLWKWCEENKVRITVEWVARNENKKADELSKTCPTKWRLNQAALTEMKKYGDYWIVKSVSEVSQLVGDTKGLIFPDLNSIGQCIDDMVRGRVSAVLIHPVWTYQTWWTRLVERRKKSVYLGKWIDACIADKGGYSKEIPWIVAASWL